MRQLLTDTAHVSKRQYVAAGQQLAQRAQYLDMFGGNQMKECSGKPERRNAVFLYKETNVFRSYPFARR